MLQLHARVADSRGNPLVSREVTWSSVDEFVATVDSSTGLVTGVGRGATTITAESENVIEAVSVRIVPAFDLPATETPPPADTSTVTPLETPTLPTRTPADEMGLRPVRIIPDSLKLVIPYTVQLKVLVTETEGAPVENPEVTWTSGDSKIVTVSSTGLVTAIKEGETVITAEYGESKGNAKITAAPTCGPVPLPHVIVAQVQLDGESVHTGIIVIALIDNIFAGNGEELDDGSYRIVVNPPGEPACKFVDRQILFDILIVDTQQTIRARADSQKLYRQGGADRVLLTASSK